MRMSLKERLCRATYSLFLASADRFAGLRQPGASLDLDQRHQPAATGNQVNLPGADPESLGRGCDTP